MENVKIRKPSEEKIWLKYYSKEELNITVPDMSLTEYIYLKNKNRLNLCSLNYFDKKVSYEELFDQIEKTSKRFQKYGVKEQDYVALAMPLTPEVIYMIYGLDNIGAAANLIDPRVPEERMKYYLNLAESKIAAISSPFISTMRNASKYTSLNTIINTSLFESLDSTKQKEILKNMFDEKNIKKIFLKNIREEILNNFYNAKAKISGKSKIIKYNDFYNTEVNELNKIQYKSGKTSIVEYTSGTTGIPKGLELTSKGMNVTAEQLSIINKTTAGESILAIMPPFISYGAVTGIHNSLGCGFEMILVPNFSTNIFADLIKKHKPNNLICVPSMFECAINSGKLKYENASYIKRIIFGGDKTPVKLEEEVNEWLKNHNSNATLIKGGGMAEFSSCTFETPFENTKKPGIYGIPLPLVEAKIMKDDNTECNYYEVGEIYICAPQEMKCYVKNEKETNDFFYIDKDGKRWGRSGDLGYIDADGMFILTSRKKHMIIRPDGHNVFPNEIEASILNSDFVKNCVVIGIKDSISMTGEYPYAFIELKDDFLNNKDSILKNIKDKVAKEIPIRDRPKDDAYIIMNLLYSKEGKLDREAMIKSLKL